MYVCRDLKKREKRERKDRQVCSRRRDNDKNVLSLSDFHPARGSPRPRVHVREHRLLRHVPSAAKALRNEVRISTSAAQARRLDPTIALRRTAPSTCASFRQDNEALLKLTPRANRLNSQQSGASVPWMMKRSG